MSAMQALELLKEAARRGIAVPGEISSEAAVSGPPLSRGYENGGRTEGRDPPV